MRRVVTDGTGKAAQLRNQPSAGKTGTTNNYEDAWFVGYTPQIATAVWMGAPEGKLPMTSVGGIRVMGGTYPAEIWRDYMRAELADAPRVNLVGPDPSKFERGECLSVEGLVAKQRVEERLAKRAIRDAERAAEKAAKEAAKEAERQAKKLADEQEKAAKEAEKAAKEAARIAAKEAAKATSAAARLSDDLSGPVGRGFGVSAAVGSIRSNQTNQPNKQTTRRKRAKTTKTSSDSGSKTSRRRRSSGCSADFSFERTMAADREADGTSSDTSSGDAETVATEAGTKSSKRRTPRPSTRRPRPRLKTSVARTSTRPGPIAEAEVRSETPRSSRAPEPVVAPNTIAVVAPGPEPTPSPQTIPVPSPPPAPTSAFSACATATAGRITSSGLITSKS